MNFNRRSIKIATVIAGVGAVSIAAAAFFPLAMSWSPHLPSTQLRIPSKLDEYLAAQRGRLEQIANSRPTEEDLRSIPESLREGQCLPASMHTVVRTLSYKDFVKGLENYLTPEGIPFYQIPSALEHHRLHSTYYKVFFDGVGMVRQLANDLDDGKVVFLMTTTRISGADSANTKVRPELPHVVRVVSVFRSSTGDPVDFGIYDVNAVGRTLQVSSIDLARLLTSARLASGAFVSHRSVLPSIH